MDDLYADLAAFDDDPLPNDLDNTPPPDLDDQVQVDRYLRRLGHIEAEGRRIVRLVAAEQERVGQWGEDRMVALDRAAAWLERSIEGFHRRHVQRGGGKTLNLPHGTLRLRKAQPKVEVADSAVAGLPEQYTNTKVTADKAALKKALKPGGPEAKDGTVPIAGAERRLAVDPATGEVVNGVVFLVPTEDSFSLKMTERGQ